MVQAFWHITAFRPAAPGAGGRSIRRLLLPLLLAGAVLGPPARAAGPDAVTSDAGMDATGSIGRPAEAPRPPVLARDARIAGDEGRTRLVLDLDRPVEIRTFTLADPYRVVVDLDDVVFAMAPAPEQLQRGIVTACRYGVLAPGKARMVLDAGGPVAIEKAFILDAADDQPARLVVDLVPTDAATFARTLASAARTPAAAPAPVAAPAAGDTRPVIVIDPGHGGIDSGTTGYSAYAEKNIVLETGRALRDKLEKTGTYRVVMTRDADVFIPLGERVRIARAHQASLFISLHADALARNDGKARGASVYTLSETASDADAARLAEQENKADLIAGVNLSDESDAVAGILVDLAQRETRSFSAHFARELVHSLKGVARTHRGALKSAGFRVLRAHDVPSVLVELGYMSSKEDLKLLTSDAWRDQVSDAMAAAIGDFFAATRAAGQTARAEPGKAAD
ncbi:N-acetylmuramoyl-L-alanine amidase [Xanthobacter sediminis]|uniref:N-acetylmuramoyl-L-alanine amidase n=1 Tax=Xanthobacter sediminis TaxID=3119926 RepID=UPI00372A1EEA